MGQLLNIRRLMVDLHIFGAVPASIWAGFEGLETLTIIFYPFPDIKDAEVEGWSHPPKLVKRQRGTKHGKRVDWIYNSASRSLATAKKTEMPEWRVPKIEVLVWGIVDKDGEGCEIYVEEEWTEEELKEDDDEEENDSNWYKQAAATITHTVPKPLIQMLKRMHYPSRMRGLGSDSQLGKRDLESPRKINGNILGTYITDSEAGDEERKALLDDDEC